MTSELPKAEIEKILAVALKNRGNLHGVPIEQLCLMSLMYLAKKEEFIRMENAWRRKVQELELKRGNE